VTSFTSRLGKRLREQDGIAPALESFLNADDEDAYAQFGIEATFNRRKLIAKLAVAQVNEAIRKHLAERLVIVRRRRFLMTGR
jgi:predicted Zn-dependent peptidase